MTGGVEPSPAQSDLSTVGRTIAVVALDYFRWTQFVPMLVAWAFLLLALALMALANFQEQGFRVAESLILLWERYPWLPRLDGAVNQTETGGLTLDDQGFREVVVSLWTGIALVGFLLSLAGRALFGPLKAASFRRKLLRVAVPLGVVWLCFMGVFLFGSEEFQGPAWQWVLAFTVGCSLVMAVSVYSLGVGHGVGRLQESLNQRR